MATRRRFDFKFKETVLKFAEETSAAEAARHFNVHWKRVGEWRKQEEELRRADQARARLAGGGRKKVSEELEESLAAWISSMRSKNRKVTRTMIKKKALEIYPAVSDGGRAFVASAGWLQRFLKRNEVSLRRHTAVAPQEDVTLLPKRLVWFIDYIGKTVSSRRMLERDIIVMDQTEVCLDKTSRLTVVLAAKDNGIKLKPFVVFRGADGGVEASQTSGGVEALQTSGSVEASQTSGGVEALQTSGGVEALQTSGSVEVSQTSGGVEALQTSGSVEASQTSSAVIYMSASSLMSDELTARWLQSVVGKSNATPRLLVCRHVGAATKAELKCGYNITMVTIPGDGEEPTDMMWNEPFRQSVHTAYEWWMAGDVEKEFTPAGELRPPARHLLVDWVVAAWDRLDRDMIDKSFRASGLLVESDGGEDYFVVCLRRRKPRGARREARRRSCELDEEVKEDDA